MVRMSRRLFWTMCAVLAHNLALAQAANYPPPFPREGVAHVLENERAIVWDVRWTRGRPTAMHEHTLDLVGVVLEAGRTKVTFPDGSSREGAPSALGDVIFQPKGVIHIEESIADGGRTIGVELKESGAASQHDLFGLAPAFPRDGATLRLDNDRVAIWDYQWIAGQVVPMHAHQRDAVVVPLDPGQVRMTDGQGTTWIESYVIGEVYFIPGGSSRSEEALSSAVRAIIIELK